MLDRQILELLKRRRLVRVFVSSTWPDLKSEREWLVRGIFPQLRQLCERRGLTWGWTDIRFDLPSERSEADLLLPGSLHHLGESAGLFIALLGERYGFVPQEIPDDLKIREPWVEKHPGASITELEITAGVFNQPKHASLAHFYFRAPSFCDSLPFEERIRYLEEAVPEPIIGQSPETALTIAQERAQNRRERLRLLKDKIRKGGFNLHPEYQTPKELGETILRDLTAAIEELFPEKHLPDALELESFEQEATVDSQSDCWISRPQLLDRLTHHAGDNGSPLLLTGPAGCGKSTLLAEWAQRHRFSHPDRIVLLHHLRETDQDDCPVAMVHRLMRELGKRCEIPVELPTHVGHLRSEFAGFLHQVAARRRIILLIDGVERLETGDRSNGSIATWFPSQLPANIRLVVAVRPGRTFEELAIRRWLVTPIEEFKPAERRGLAKKILKDRRSFLSPARLERIAAVPTSGNPLFLRTVLATLPDVLDDDQIDRSLADALGKKSVEELYETFLSNVEAQFDSLWRGLVSQTLSLIWASRGGLSELELRELLGQAGEPIPPQIWYPLLFALRPILIKPAGRLRLAHETIRDFVGKRYIRFVSEAEQRHAHLANYFRNAEPTVRSFLETVYHLKQTRTWGALYGILANTQVLGVACHADLADTQDLWHEIETNSPLRMLDAYAPFLDGADRPLPAATLVARLLTGAGHAKEASSLQRYLAGILRDLGDKLPLLEMLDDLAENLLAISDREGARVALEEAVGIARSLDHQERLAKLLARLARVFQELGLMEKATGLLEESESLFRKGWDPDHRQEGLGRLAQLRYLQGDLDASLDGFREQEKLCRELGRKDGLAESLYGQSSILRSRGDLERATDLLKEMEAICRDSGFKEGLQGALNGMAVISRARGNLDHAMMRLKEAEALCREINHLPGLQQSLGGQGSIRRARGSLDDAMSTFREQEKICRQITCKEGLQIALAGQASILRDRGQLDDAMTLFKQAEKLCREIGFHEGMQRILCNQAMILRDRGDLDGALIQLRESERICRQLGLRSGLQRTLENLALVLKSRGDLDGAMALLKEQERICRDLGIQVGLQVALGNQAHILHFRGDYDGAMALFQEQERICRDLGLKDRLQMALAGQAVIRRARGDIEQSMTLLKEQEKICNELGLKAGLQVSFYHQAIILLMRGDLDGAMGLFRRQEAICREAGYKEGLQASLGSQAVILRNRGDLDGSMALFKKQEQICRESGYKEGLQVALCGQAAILQARGNLDEAMKLLVEGEGICRDLGHREGLQRVLCSQSLILQARGNPTRAMEVLREAEKICRSLDYKSGLQRILENMASILQLQGKPEEALDLLKQQETICREVGIRAGLQACLGSQAMILKSRGEFDGAMLLLKEQELICRDLGLKAGLAKTLANQAQILAMKMDKMRDALSLVTEAFRLATDHGLLALANQIKGVLDGMRQQIDGGGDPHLRDLGQLNALQAKLSTQAALFRNRGDLDRALAQLKTQERICRELGDLDELGTALDNQGQILRERGQHAEALARFKDAEQTFRTAGNRAGLAESLINQALLLVLDLKRPVEALPLAQEACRLVENENLAEVPRETLKLLLDYIHSQIG